ncbi:PREDICTED: probable G-protein coupled receptor 116 isoform X5 [Cercocebus atys]|uniref:probable G-protein coupled receptor 116 isoform X5 n=1 Tax=Cercocebus atys TaxID=9531 RepID=UPI0005F4DBEB|nr:PREDICTED: probable G-protein coupled receptor 116 isoform X5 [Cercocebus atys]
MKSPKRTTLCLMFIVIYSSKATLNWNLESTIRPLSLHEYEPADEEAPRQKRAVATKSPTAEEYTVNIEISFENASFLDPIKAYLNSLSFPIHGNNTDQILSINVTTVCRPAGNEIWCSCETGYGWPRERCLHSLTCQEHDVFLPGHHCSCLKELPTKGPFCLLQEDVTLNMRVRLNVGFQEDLMNTSSALYRSYKTDLETAFRKGYGILPGFKGVTVTGFKSGSVVVTYEVKTTAPSLELIHKANEQVVQSLNQTYKMDYNSFQALTSNETKFSVTPEIIFEGDTVSLVCENELLSSNVSWRYEEQQLEIQNSSKFSIYTAVFNNMTSVSKLTIRNITPGDAGEYVCKLILDIFEYEGKKKIDVMPIQILANEEMKVMCDNNPVSLNCCSQSNVNWSKVEWKQEGKISIPGTPETDIDSSCSRYTLKADGTQCPSGSSGTAVVYTCEFISAYGARGSANIKVTFISVGTYHCIFRYKNSYSIATKDVVVHPLPLELNIMVDPLEATVLCSGSHHIKCCIEEDGDYKVTFRMGSLSLPAEKEVNKKQVCYKHNFSANSVSWCSKTVDVYCHFTNAANNSVWSPSMKLNLVPGENITCQDPILGVGEPGKVIQKLCRFSNIPSSPDSPVGGIITYKCVGSQWEEKRNDCIFAPVNSLLQMAKALIKSPSQDEKLPTYLKDLSISIDKAEHEISSSPASLGAIINILDLLSTVPTEVNSETMMHVLSTVNVILGKPVLNTWKVLQQRWTNQSSQLLHSVERFSQALQSGDSPPLSFFRTNVQMSSMVIKSSHPKTYQQRFVFPHFDLWGNVVIDKSYLEKLQSDSSIVTMAFPTLQAILAQDIQENNFADSLVMTTTVNHNMTMPFRISMTFKNNSPSGGKTQCVFWNFRLADNTGGWDSSGCYVEEGDGDNVTCICDHLTSFSILMSPDSPDPSSLLGILLDIISYVGVGFSILSLAACLVVEAVVWKSVTKNRTSYMRHTCIVNIAASLLIANTWFIVVAAIQDNRYILYKTACVAATFFIHFFYLSVFFWMLTLGLMLFYRLVFILHETSRSTQKAIAFCLGYGCPLAISVITLGATQPREVYTRKNVCWLNWEDTKALLAFAIPALIIVVVNITITIVVITKILRPSIGDKPCKQEKSSLFQISKSIGVLTPLLGLTWGFGLTTVFPGTNLVFHIIFAILNVFQGLFILLFGCLWDLKVQEALLNKFSLSRWSSQHSKSTSLGSSTPVFSMSSPISRRFNNLFGKTGTYNVSTPETTSSSLENSSSAYSLLN